MTPILRNADTSKIAQAPRSPPFFRPPLLDTSTGGIAVLQWKEIVLQWHPVATLNTEP